MRVIKKIRDNIYLYDTLDNTKKRFIPINGNKVLMYVCGPTVYDKTHLGHARVYIFFDALRRFFEYLGYEVKYIINFTDIDDKIIKKANEEKKHWEEISDKYERYFLKAIKFLKIKEPTNFTRATRHITDIIDYVKRLEEAGFAYELDDGIYFNVRKFKDYGKLSKQKLEYIEEHYRIEPNPKKINKADFSLWKYHKENEPYWYSLWKKGRPGWHIECSVMILKHLGESIDIHGGGLDLIFPHHENEIAQMESLTKKRFVNFWMHVGLVMVNNEKMSKSLGNFITIDELKKYPGELIRYYILKTHWRKPLNFSLESLEKEKQSWLEIVNLYYELYQIYLYKKYPGEKNIINNKNYLEEFLMALADNFNTPKAYSILFKFKNEVYKNINKLSKRDVINSLKFLREIDKILRIIPKIKKEKILLIKKLLELRNEYRKIKNYNKADEIREYLSKLGYQIKDYRDYSVFLIKNV